MQHSAADTRTGGDMKTTLQQASKTRVGGKRMRLFIGRIGTLERFHVLALALLFLLLPLYATADPLFGTEAEAVASAGVCQDSHTVFDPVASSTGAACGANGGAGSIVMLNSIGVFAEAAATESVQFAGTHSFGSFFDYLTVPGPAGATEYYNLSFSHDFSVSPAAGGGAEVTGRVSLFDPSGQGGIYLADDSAT